MAKVINRETGQIEEVDDPSSGLLSGAYSLPKGAPVRVKDETGTVVEFDAEENQDFLRDLASGKAEGYSWATEREALLQEADEQNASALGQGSLRSITGGASDAIQARMSDDPIAERERLAILREANPIASGIGEIGTDVASALLSGGVSAFAKGGAKVAGKMLAREGAEAVAEGAAKRIAKGATGAAGKVLGNAPSGAITQVSGLAGEGVGKLAAKAGGGQFAQSAARLGTEGAIEGAAFALRDAQVDAYLQGEDLTGEQALAAMGHGALYGAAGGAGLAGLGVAARGVARGTKAAARQGTRAVKAAYRIVPKETRESLQDLARRAGFEASDGAADDAVRIIEAQGDALRDVQRDITRVRRDLGDEAADDLELFAKRREYREAVERTDEVQTRITDEVQESATAFDRASNRSQAGFARGGKREIWERALPEQVDDRAFAEATGFFTQADEIGKQFIQENASKWKNSTAGKRILGLKEAYESKFAKLVEKAESGADARKLTSELYLDLDNLKREIGTATQNAYKSPGKQAEAETLESFYEEIRGFLQRDDLFGEAATIQKQVNAVWTEKIAATKARGVRGVFENAGVIADETAGGLKTSGFDKRDLQRMNRSRAQTLAKAGDRDALGDMVRYMDASIETAKQMADAGFDGAAKELDRMLTARDRFLKAIEGAGLVQDALSKRDRLNTLAQRAAQQRSLGRRVGTQVVGALGGGMVGGIPGAAMGAAAAEGLGAAFRRVDDPLGAVLTRFAQEESGSPAARSLIEKLGDMAQPQVFRAKRAIDLTRRTVAKAARSVVKGGERGAVKAVSGIAVKSFQERAQSLVSEEPPENPLGGGQYAQVVQGKAQEGRQYLRDALPATAQPSPYEPDKVRQPADSDARDWILRADAVESPLSVIEAIERGETPAQGLEVLQQIYPSIYGQLRDSVLSEAQNQGDKLTHATRARIEQLFPELRDPQTAPPSGQAPPPQQPQAPAGFAPKRVPRVDVSATSGRATHEMATERVAGRPAA